MTGGAADSTLSVVDPVCPIGADYLLVRPVLDNLDIHGRLVCGGCVVLCSHLILHSWVTHSAALLDLRHQRASMYGRYGDVLLRDETSRGVGIFFLISGTALFAYLLATVVTLATIEFKMMSCHSYFAKPVSLTVDLSQLRSVTE